MNEEQHNERPVNYILPETERTVREMTGSILKTFDLIRLVCSALYLLFLSLRFAFFRGKVWLEAILLTFFALQFLFLVLEYAGKMKSGKIRLVLFRMKMIPSLVMIILVCHDIFSDLNRLMPWQVVMVMFMGLGWLLLLVGDLFSHFVPPFMEKLLDSFKADIGAKGILSRAGHELKYAAKDKAKDVFNAQSMTEVAAKAGGLLVGGVGGMYLIDKLAKKIRAKKENKNSEEKNK